MESIQNIRFNIIVQSFLKNHSLKLSVTLFITLSTNKHHDDAKIVKIILHIN